MPAFAIQGARPGLEDDAGGRWDNAPTTFAGAVQAAWDDGWQTRNMGVRTNRLRDELFHRDGMVRKALGLPMGAGNGGLPRSALMTTAEDPNALSEDDYERRIEALRAEHPRELQGIETRSALLARINQDLGDVRARADQAGAEHPVAAFLGGSAAALTDPLNLVATVLTGGAGAGRPLLARMGMQALANAGVEAAQVPARIGDAQVAGPKYEAREAVTDVLAAGAGGAGFEALGAGAKRAWRAVFPQLGATPAGRLTRDHIETALRDDAALGPLDGAAHDEGMSALAAQGRRPQLEPAQEIGDLFGEAPQKPPRDLGGGFSAQAQTVDYYGRRIEARSFDPAELETDAGTFQYKADADAEGVTARLRGVDVWDPTSSGKVIVYERADGTRVIADGHQRRALARRMAEKGWDAQLDGYLFREADGWTARQVRTLAALKNIREGSGTMLDAAKVFRDAPELLNDRSLPITGEFITRARALARLHPEAFGAVVNKVVDERYAAEIGAMAAGRQDLHPALVKLLHDGKPANVEEARALISEAMLDDWVSTEGEQADFFGNLPPESTTIARAKVKAAVAGALRKDARIYGQLVKNADAIEAGGNVLLRDANETAAAVNRTALEVLNRLSLRAGDIGEAMAAAAREVLDGKRPADAAKSVLTMVRNRLKAGEGLAETRAAAIDPPPPSPTALNAIASADDPKAWEAAAFEPPEAEGRPPPAGLFDDLDPAGDYELAHQRLLACAPAAPKAEAAE